MRATVRTVCEATVHETWEVEVDRHATDEEIIEQAREAIQMGNADFIYERAEDERDREVTTIFVSLREIKVEEVERAG